MNKKLFTALVLATLALIVVAIIQTGFTAKSESAQETKLFPQFAQKMTAVDRIALVENDNNTLVLVKKNEQWVIASKDDYPANVIALRKLFEALKVAEKREAKTADETKYAQIGVQNDAEQLTLHVGDEVQYAVYLGNEVSRPEGQFVRLKDDKQTWLLDRKIPVSDSVSEWAQFSLPNLSSAEIKSVERYHFTGVQCVMAPCDEARTTDFSLSKADAAASSFALQPIPAKKQAAPAWKLAGITEGLNGLAITDVAKLPSLFTSEVKPTRTVYTRFDGLVVEIALAKIEEKFWINFSFTSEDSAPENIKKEAASFDVALRDWVFEIASYKAEGLTRSHQELLDDKKE